MVNTKCIRYSVDPDMLNAGIPVEQLERKNVHEFQSQETIDHLNRYAQGTDRLCTPKVVTERLALSEVEGSRSIEHYPRPIASKQLEIELTSSDYNKVLSGKLIKIGSDIAKHQGKKFKVVNKDTGSYVMRVLIVVGDMGYWR